MNLLPLSRLGLVSRALIMALAAAMIIGLGFLRVATDAEYAFTSVSIIPVIVAAWCCGRNPGTLLAALAAVSWAIGDFAANKVYSSEWIPAINATTRAVTYVAVVLIVSWLKDLLTQVEHMAAHDHLTGLLNRRAFGDFGAEEIERSRRYKHSLALIFIDLDNFKKLNDSQGHHAGDKALQATAQALRHVLRASDVLARLGGDEFAIILPEIDYESAAETGQKIVSAIRRAMQEYPPVSASVGVAWYRTPGQRFADMLHGADALMYEVKQQSKSGVLVRSFDEPVDAVSRETASSA